MYENEIATLRIVFIKLYRILSNLKALLHVELTRDFLIEKGNGSKLLSIAFCSTAEAT